MHSRRAILLASSALVGIGSLTGWQDQALAATCTAAAGVVTCSGASTTATDNPVIAGVFPDVTVNADATALIDTKTGGAPLTVPATSNGTVKVNNLGTIGLAVGDFGIDVIGDPTKTAVATPLDPNNVTITNNKIVNGIVEIGTGLANGAGGTGTIVNTLTITGSTGTAGGVGVNIWSTGDATLTSNTAGAIITGATRVMSQAPAAVATVDVTGKITTTATPGGIASALIGDVGVVKGQAAEPVFNPDGFIGSTVIVNGIKSANATLSGHTGGVTIKSSSAITIADTGTAVVDGAGNTTLTTKAIAITGASVGGAQASLTATGQIIGGALSVTSPGGVSAQITGFISPTVVAGPDTFTGAGALISPAVPVGANAATLVAGGFFQNETDTTTVKDSKAVLISFVSAVSKVDVGGGVTLTVDPTGILNGTLTTTSDKGQTIVINGQVGKLDPTPTFQSTKGQILAKGDSSFEAASQKSLDTQTTTWNDVGGVGVLATFTEVNNTKTDTGGDISYTLGATGSVAGPTTIKTGGNLTAVITGLLGSSKNGAVALNADLTMSDSLVSESAIDTTFTTKDIWDPTGLILVSQTLGSTFADSGGGATVTVDPTGVVTGTVSITSNLAQTLTFNGTGSGQVTQTATASTGSDTNVTIWEPTKGLLVSFTDTNNTNTDVGGNVTDVIGATGKLSAPLVISTGGDVSLTNNGLIGLGTVSGTGVSIDSRAGFFGGSATDQTTTTTETWDKTGLIVNSLATTDNRAATGGGVTFLNAAGANIAGNVFITADGPTVFTNNGGIERSVQADLITLSGAGNVTILDRRTLQTKNDVSPIGSNFVTTLPVAPAISPVDTIFKGSQSTITKTVGGSVNFTNTSFNTIDGAVSITALGNITFLNSGFIVGDVRLLSDGISTAFTSKGSTDNFLVFGDVANPTVFTQQTITTVPTATNFTNTVTTIGGSVTATYSGIDGINNPNIDPFFLPNLPEANSNTGAGQADTVTLGAGNAAWNAIGGGFNIISGSHIGIFQSADTTSSATVSGTLYAGLCSIAGIAGACGSATGTGTTTQTSTQTIVDVINNDTTTTPGSALLTGGSVTINTATTGINTANFTPSAGTASNVTISGNVLRGIGFAAGFPGTDSDVYSAAPFGSTITVSGSVQGIVEADAFSASTTGSDTIAQTWAIDGTDATPAGPGTPFVPDKNGKVQETAFNETLISTQTGAGGAATISVTGVKGVYGAFAFGATGATVTIDAASKIIASPARGNLGVFVDTDEVPRDIVNTTTTARVYSGTKFTQTITNVTTSNSSALAGNALATINGPVAGRVWVESARGNATAAIGNYVNSGSFANNAVTANANATTISTNFTSVQTSSSNQTGPIKLTPTGVALGPTQPIGGVVIPPGDLGTATNPGTSFKAFVFASTAESSTTVSVGGNAAITLTAPPSVIALGGNNFNGLLINGTVNANGDKSATITNSAGTIVNGSVNASSFPQTFVTGMASPLTGVFSTTEKFNKSGILDSRTLIVSNTFNGGTATVTNNGEIRGTFGSGVSVNSEGTSTFTNTGIVGTFNGAVTGNNSNWFTGNTFSNVSTVQTNLSTTTADTGLSDPVTLGPDPLHGTRTVTQVWTPVGGTSTATNSGVIWGSLELDGVTGTVTNTGAIGSGFGSIGGGINLGTAVNNHTIVTTTKSNVTTLVETFAPLFNQTYTVDQSGVVAAGITVRGATIFDPLGASASPPNVDAFGNTLQVKTSNIVATINLNNKSVTLDGVAAEMGVLDSNLATFFTTTAVNLNGNDYVGLNTNAFATLPSLTKQQLQFVSSQFGASTDNILTGATTLVDVASVTGVNALTRNAGGITFFTGVNYNNANSPRLVDDTYAIRVNTFNVLAGGEMQFAMDFEPIEFEGSSFCSAFFGTICAFNAPQPLSNIFGISGAVSNSGTFVLGARASEPTPANFGNVVTSSPMIIEGLTFRIDGSFTQTATGTLVTGIAPSLIRQFEPGLTTPTVGEVLGVPTNSLALPLFTVPAKSGIVVSTPSLVFLSGNLTLGGTVQVAVSRNALYAVNQTTPLFIVTPSITPTTGAVAAVAPTVVVTAAVTTSIPSPFLGFSLTTSTTGAGAATVTTVSLVSQRKSFATAATNSNAAAAGHALDSDISALVPAITADAIGTGPFTGVQQQGDAQDLATIISDLDFLLTPGQAALVLNDLGGGSFYGSVRAFDTSRVLRDGFDTEAAIATDMDRVGLAIWANPIFRSTKLDGNSSIGTGDITGDEGGVTAGIDFRFTNNIGVGFGGGYTKNRLKDSDPATADVDSWMIGSNIYYVRGPWLVSGQIDYARSNYSVNRQLPAMSREAHAEFGGTELRGQAEVGYKFYMIAADGDLTPYLAVDWRRAETHAFTETGAGGVNLVVNGKSDSVVNPRIGLRWDGTNWGTTAFTVKPKIEGSYTFSNDIDTTGTMHFAGGEDVIATQGIQGKGYGTIQLGVVGSIGQTGSIGITGGFDFGGNRTATSISANFRIEM